jgi:hypothetical protein
MWLNAGSASRSRSRFADWVPGGIAVAVGKFFKSIMRIVPTKAQVFTIPRHLQLLEPLEAF